MKHIFTCRLQVFVTMNCSCTDCTVRVLHPESAITEFQKNYCATLISWLKMMPTKLLICTKADAFHPVRHIFHLCLNIPSAGQPLAPLHTATPMSAWKTAPIGKGITNHLQYLTIMAKT